MASLKRETSVTLDKADMALILTEELCRYGCFGQLRVAYISQNKDGDFDLTLEPVPAEPAT